MKFLVGVCFGLALGIFLTTLDPHWVSDEKFEQMKENYHEQGVLLWMSKDGHKIGLVYEGHLEEEIYKLRMEEKELLGKNVMDGYYR